MRIFLDNKGVSTLWSQFKAKLAAHADDSNIHVTAEEKAAWDGKAELSDIPTTLPANGGNADTLDGLHANEIASNPNLLINPDFKINQRGTSTWDYGADLGYCVDCWKINSGSLSDSGLLVKGTAYLVQELEGDFKNKSLTLSVMRADGKMTHSSFVTGEGEGFYNITDNDLFIEFGHKLQSNSYVSIHPITKDVAIKYAKLEIGSIATPFCPPNHATELLRIQAMDGTIPADTIDGKHASDFVPYHSYAPIYTGDILDISEMGTYSCAADGCTNLPSEIASWCYVTAFDFRDAGYKRFICVALNDIAVYPNVIWLASESNKTSDGKLIWSKANDGGNADTVDGKHASDFADNIYKGYPTEGNCNNATAQGVYTVSNNSTNAPGSDFYTLIVDVAGDGTWIVQNAISAGTESVAYRRTRINGNWGTWKNIADGGNAATVNGYTVNANVPAGFSSIGQNTENKTYTYGRVTYTGHNTSEVFNNYTENMAANEYSHAEGYDTKALGDHSHAEGSSTKALGVHSHAEGSMTEASGDSSHAECMDTTASGNCSHAEGWMTVASSYVSHAEGENTRASGSYSHAEGKDTKASSNYSHAEGSMTEASGEGSHAEGMMTGASSSASHAEGYGTIASSFASHAGGKYSKAMTNSTGETDNTGDAFVIGNGTEAYTLSNAFRVTYGGAVYGLSAFNSSGADYAEFIKPWADGNPDNEDRVGYMVTIKNGLLHKANDGDYIVGITSGNPSVVGNADEDYYWRYERDDFNRFVYEDAEEEVVQLDDDGTPVLDENGMPVMVKTGNIIKNAHYKLAADYDPTKQNDYIERKNRPEWSYVGMIGVIPVRDDGTCEAGCFCKCGQNGIATRAESQGFDTFFVIDRISDNVVSVEIR